MKEKFFDFIKLQTPNLKKVLDVKLKDVDDETGFIGEHYEVLCLLSVPDTNIPINNMLAEKEQACLVNKSEFKKWLKGENSIKWI
jgi:hypothetical protein